MPQDTVVKVKLLHILPNSLEVMLLFMVHRLKKQNFPCYNKDISIYVYQCCVQEGFILADTKTKANGQMIKQKLYIKMSNDSV